MSLKSATMNKEKNELTLVISLNETPQTSKSGKTQSLAYIPSGTVLPNVTSKDGRPVQANINVYVK